MGTRTWNFDTDTGLTYDPTKIVIGGGTAELIGGFPADLIFYNRLNNLANFNADHSVGNPVAVENNAPAHDAVIKKFGAASMNLSAGVAGRGIRFAAPGNADWSQAATMEFQFRPNYAGNPTVPFMIFFDLHDVAGFPANKCILWHGIGGSIGLLFSDNAGADMGNAAWFPYVGVPGAFVHFSLNLDATGGATRCFMDGVQAAAALPTVGIVNGPARDFLYLGTESPFASACEGWIDEFAIYNTVQHVANFVPPTQDIAGVADTTNPTIVFDEVSALALQSFDATLVDAAGCTISWAVRHRGWQHYFNRNFWDHRPTPEATVVNSCTLAQMQDNIRYMRLKGPAQLVAYFQSDGTVTPGLDQVTMDFVG